MALKFEDLLVRALELPAESRRRLAQLLIESIGRSQDEDALPVRESESPPYWADGEALAKVLAAMTSVTVVLPDDLAKQAQAAGLLGGKAMEELLRRALQEQTAGKASSEGPTRRRRRLVRQNSRLVIEALPDEQPITDAEVRRLLNQQMEW